MPEKAPGNDVPERAPRNSMPERAPRICRNRLLGMVYRKGLLRTIYRKRLLGTIPERAPKNGVSGMASYVVVESVIFHQLPTNVTRNGRATFFVSMIPSYSVEWRIEAVSHSDGPWPCGALAIYLCYELES